MRERRALSRAQALALPGPGGDGDGERAAGPGWRHACHVLLHAPLPPGAAPPGQAVLVRAGPGAGAAAGAGPGTGGRG